MKDQKTQSNPKKKWLIGVGAVIGLYIVSLFVPYISNATRLPLYLVKCGGQPITASEFAASYTYTVPGGKIYYTFGDRYYCSEQEAKDAGFRRYP
jgi:hypothetical protein